MEEAKKKSYFDRYRNGLLEDVLPFWIKNAPDYEDGGFMFSLDREGNVFDTDKGMWQQCRFTWLLSTLYHKLEQREEWLKLAHHGIRFIEQNGFDQDGRMFFHLTKEGNPIRKRRYIFTETFAIIAYAAFARASGEKWAADKAVQLWEMIMKLLHTPGALPSKCTNERPGKTLAIPMILMATAQELRENLGDDAYTDTIDTLIKRVKSDWMKPEFNAVLENVGMNGEFYDHSDGRLLNPGHSIELAWFILKEARYRGNDEDLLETGLTILDWMWEWGWDKQYGGITYFRDVKNMPVTEYWHDMKFWWPQNEAMIASLYAYQMSGYEKYLDWHEKVHNWAYKHFPDPEYGEWFGYLHKDGRRSTDLKGNMWKGPFHLPRMLWECSELLKF